MWTVRYGVEDWNGAAACGCDECSVVLGLLRKVR